MSKLLDVTPEIQNLVTGRNLEIKKTYVRHMQYVHCVQYDCLGKSKISFILTIFETCHFSIIFNLILYSTISPSRIPHPPTLLHPLSHTLSYTHTITYICTLSFTLSHTPTLTHPHSLTHTLSLSHTPTDSTSPTYSPPTPVPAKKNNYV